MISSEWMNEQLWRIEKGKRGMCGRGGDRRVNYKVQKRSLFGLI